MDDDIQQSDVPVPSRLGESDDRKKMILSNPVIVHDVDGKRDILTIKQLNYIDYLTIKGILTVLSHKGGYLHEGSITDFITDAPSNCIFLYFDDLTSMTEFYSNIQHLLILNADVEKYQSIWRRHTLNLSDRIVHIDAILRHPSQIVSPCIISHVKSRYLPDENKLMLISMNDVHVDYIYEKIMSKTFTVYDESLIVPVLYDGWTLENKKTAIYDSHVEMYNYFRERIDKHGGIIDWGDVSEDDSTDEEISYPIKEKVIVTFNGKLKDFVRDMKKFIQGYNPKMINCVCQIISRFGEITIGNLVLKDACDKIAKEYVVWYISKDHPLYSEYKKMPKERRSNPILLNITENMIPLTCKNFDRIL